jgi:hypothetical protein
MFEGRWLPVMLRGSFAETNAGAAANTWHHREKTKRCEYVNTRINGI